MYPSRILNDQGCRVAQNFKVITFFIKWPHKKSSGVRSDSFRNETPPTNPSVDSESHILELYS